MTVWNILEEHLLLFSHNPRYALWYHYTYVWSALQRRRLHYEGTFDSLSNGPWPPGKLTWLAASQIGEYYDHGYSALSACEWFIPRGYEKFIMHQICTDFYCMSDTWHYIRPTKSCSYPRELIISWSQTSAPAKWPVSLFIVFCPIVVQRLERNQYVYLFNQPSAPADCFADSFEMGQVSVGNKYRTNFWG